MFLKLTMPKLMEDTIPINCSYICYYYLDFFSNLLIVMKAATPGRSARTLDPGLSNAKEAAKALPPGKRPLQWKSATFAVAVCMRKIEILVPIDYFIQRDLEKFAWLFNSFTY